jgi:hypothetical protein
MMIERRTFLLKSLVGGVTAAIASFVPLSSILQARRSPLPNPLPTESISGETDMSSVMFKIDGWDYCDNEINGSKMIAPDLPMSEPTRNHVAIKINQSWRTTSWC